MSHVATAVEHHNLESGRPQFRLGMFTDEPVYLLLNLDGVEIDPIVEHLELGEASFVCSKHFDEFYEGQMIGPAVLALQDEGMTVVYPVVKSKHWPLISVEFMEISATDRQMIAEFLRRRRL